MSAAGSGRQVGPEIVVSLECRLHDAEDELVEALGSADPLEFVFGFGQASPKIERAIEGLTPGGSARVLLSPAEAFGHRDPGAEIIVDRSELPESAALGDEFEAERDDGETVFLRVVELDGESARLDANHPLAGQSVTLELVVLGTRIATSAELAAAEAALAAAGPGDAPDVLASRLIRRDRSTPPKYGGDEP